MKSIHTWPVEPHPLLALGKALYDCDTVHATVPRF